MLDLLKKIAVILNNQYNTLRDQIGQRPYVLKYQLNDEQKISIELLLSQKEVLSIKEFKKLLKKQLGRDFPRGTRFESFQADEKLNILKVEFPVPRGEYEKLDCEFLIHSLKSYVEFFEMQVLFLWGEEFELNKGAPPSWRKDTSESGMEEYSEFYKTYFQEGDETAPCVYVKVYEPFRVEGLLYFKRDNPFRVVGERQVIRTLVEQAVVKEVDLLDYLPKSFEHAFGVLELSDFKLSDMSSLKCSKVLQELSKNIMYEVATSIRRLNRKSRPGFEECWRDFSFFTKSSCMHNETFDQTMRSHILYQKSDGTYINLSELNSSISEGPKSPRQVIYFDALSVDLRLIDMAKRYGVEPVALLDYLDPIFMQYEENTPVAGHNVFSFYSLENQLALLGKEVDRGVSRGFKSLFRDFFTQYLPDVREDQVASELSIEVKNFHQDDPPVFICINEKDRRFFYNSRFQVAHGSLPVNMKLIVNASHVELQSLLTKPKELVYYALESYFLRAYQHIWNQVFKLTLSSEHSE